MGRFSYLPGSLWGNLWNFEFGLTKNRSRGKSGSTSKIQPWRFQCVLDCDVKLLVRLQTSKTHEKSMEKCQLRRPMVLEFDAVLHSNKISIPQLLPNGMFLKPLKRSRGMRIPDFLQMFPVPADCRCKIPKLTPFSVMNVLKTPQFLTTCVTRSKKKCHDMRGPISQVMPFVLHVIHWSSTLETWVPAMYQDEFTDWIHLEQLKKAWGFIETFSPGLNLMQTTTSWSPVLHVDVCWCLDDSLMILFELSSIMYESYRSIPLDMRGHTRTLRLCLQNSTPITLFVEDIAGIPGMLAAWCVNHLLRRWQPEANEAGVVSHDLVQPQAVWKAQGLL